MPERLTRLNTDIERGPASCGNRDVWKDLPHNTGCAARTAASRPLASYLKNLFSKKTMKTIASILSILLIGSCSHSADKGSGPGRTMNGTYVDSAGTGHNTQDTISKDINKDWNRVK